MACSILIEKRTLPVREGEHNMLAIKAIYNNGTVQWTQKPPIEGRCDLIVVFDDVSEAQSQADKVEQARLQTINKAIDRIQRLYNDIPQSTSLVDELIAERRRETLNE